MAKPQVYFHFLSITLLAFMWACTPDHETAWSTDDAGRKIQYVRRKKDFAKDGPYQKFYPNGVLLESANYVNDHLHGERKYFHPNGMLESEEHFNNGVYEGAYKKYFENGTLALEQNYLKGALEGQSVAYYPNGVVKERVTLKENEENGPFSEYYETGILKTEGFYVPGEDQPLEEGALKSYNEQGELIRIAKCKEGRCITQWKKE